MEALRYVTSSPYVFECRDTQSSLPESERKPATILRARLEDSTGLLHIENTSYRTDSLAQELRKTWPKTDDEDTVDGHPAKEHRQNDAHLELIRVPGRINKWSDAISLDRDTIKEVYKYLDLDPWLLALFRHTQAGWTCCNFAKGILNFQLLTNMYYIAWSINTNSGITRTRAILIPHEHILVSHWFSSEAQFQAILRSPVIDLRDPFGLANLVLLDLITHMGSQLNTPWHMEIKSENISGHGTFGYGNDVKSSDLNTQNLATAAKEIGLAFAAVSYCNRLVDLAEQMVTDLKDEVEKSHRAPQDGEQSEIQSTGWKDHSSMIQALHSNEKRIWHLKIEAKDLDNRVRAQSGTIFALIANGHAEATRLDSGSMKTIAIMTMVFLPGTFLAALFAVPSLDWGGPQVITNDFWVYWVFTIPFTILVFIIWYVLSLDYPLRKLVGRVWARHETLGDD